MNDTDLILYISLGAFIATFVYYLIVWYVFGKDDKLKPIVPTYKMPKGLSLGQAEILKNDGMYFSRSKAFEMSLASLISKGFIEVSHYDEQRVIFKRMDKNIKDVEFNEEKVIFEKLFEFFDELTVFYKYTETNEDVQSVFVDTYKSYLKAITKMKREIVKNNGFLLLGGLIIHAMFLYVWHNEAIDNSLKDLNIQIMFFIISLLVVSFLFLKDYIGNVSFVLFLPFGYIISNKKFFQIEYVMANLNQEMLVNILVGIITCFLHILFMFLLKKPNKKAREMLEEIKGFKMFVETAEKEKFKEMTEEIYEKNLPYAYFLGVQKGWSEGYSSFKEIKPQGKVLFDVLGKGYIKKIIRCLTSIPKELFDFILKFVLFPLFIILYILFKL